MSLDLAKTWATQALHNPGARKTVLESFDQAAVKGDRVTLIVDPSLMTSGKGCLARWTGTELVVVELSARQRRGLGVQANGLVRHVLPRDKSSDLPSQRCLTLCDVKIETSNGYDGHAALPGTCRFSFDDPTATPMMACALRVQYFHPDLPSSVTGYWLVGGALLPPGGELRFSLPPLVPTKEPIPIRGSLVMFLQLVTATNWQTKEGLRTISNLTAVVIGLK